MFLSIYSNPFYSAGGKAACSSAEKSKQPRYELNQTQRKLIKCDTANAKLWKEIVESTGSVSIRIGRHFF